MNLKPLLLHTILLSNFIKELFFASSIKLSLFTILTLVINPIPTQTANKHCTKNVFKEKLIANTLFIVRHNKSPNYVVYQANIEADKKLNASNPIDVFWFMQTKGKTTEKVTFIEWKLAYGFELDELKKSEEYKLNLHAFDNKAIIVKKNYAGIYSSYMIINGENAKLKDVFINFESTFGFPSVKYLDFKGTNIRTGKFTTERFFPN